MKSPATSGHMWNCLPLIATSCGTRFCCTQYILVIWGELYKWLVFQEVETILSFQHVLTWWRRRIVIFIWIQLHWEFFWPLQTTVSSTHMFIQQWMKHNLYLIYLYRNHSYICLIFKKCWFTGLCKISIQAIKHISCVNSLYYFCFSKPKSNDSKQTEFKLIVTLQRAGSADLNLLQWWSYNVWGSPSVKIRLGWWRRKWVTSGNTKGSRSGQMIIELKVRHTEQKRTAKGKTSFKDVLLFWGDIHTCDLCCLQDCGVWMLPRVHEAGWCAWLSCRYDAVRATGLSVY